MGRWALLTEKGFAISLRAAEMSQLEKELQRANVFFRSSSHVALNLAGPFSISCLPVYTLKPKVLSPLLHNLPIDARAAADDDDNRLVLCKQVAVALGAQQSDGRATRWLDQYTMLIEQEGARVDRLRVCDGARVGRVRLRELHCRG